MAAFVARQSFKIIPSKEVVEIENLVFFFVE